MDRVSVIGGSAIDDDHRDLALAVGRELAARGYTVVCGGRGGTMAAVCEGAKLAGGTTIGILPGEDRTAANEYVDVAIATGLGHARNALVPLNGDAVIALPGSYGTHTEVGFAGIYGRPIVGLATEGDDLETVETPTAAVAFVDNALNGS